MHGYNLDVRYRKAVQDRRIIIAMQALTDAEALRAAHPVADLAEREGAEDVQVGITAAEGRDVGFFGDSNGSLDYLDRPERRAPAYRHPSTES